MDQKPNLNDAFNQMAKQINDALGPFLEDLPLPEPEPWYSRLVDSFLTWYMRFVIVVATVLLTIPVLTIRAIVDAIKFLWTL